MSDKYDVIIIGGGIVGVSTAFHLSRRGCRTAVLERKFVAAEATGRSSGLVRMHYDLEAESRLAWASFDYFRNWQERVGGECGFTRTGFLQIVAPAHNERLRANVAMHQRIGIPSLLVTADDVKRLAPGLYTSDFELAAYEPESGYADPGSTAASLMTSARERGTRLIQDCRVSQIKTSGDRVTGVETNRGDLDAPVILNAAGAWAAEIGRLAGVELPVDTWWHDVAFIRRPPALQPHPTVIDLSLSMYFRPETGGLTLVALEDNSQFGEPPESDAEHVTPGFVERAVERLCRRVPGMDAGSLKTAYRGCDGITPDQRLILDQAGPEGFYVACGFSGTGFKLGPAVGACVSELILDGQATTVDISPFALRRFETGKLLKGEHAYETLWR
jgi:glycine/D-amino acid oxidase-like deaminating enzyme